MSASGGRFATAAGSSSSASGGAAASATAVESITSSTDFTIVFGTMPCSSL